MKQSVAADKKLWREKDKSEITAVGRFLRKFHLDELPQLINILKGDISFVGPRPEWVRLAEIFEKEIPFYSLRYLLRPGLTGWAQLNFPASSSVAEAKEKFKYDLYYIENHSFFFDLEIILKTIFLSFF
jgi:lipopolysaccharide/colanic/teichoic acid biosynthesis glycosyltransferase